MKTRARTGLLVMAMLAPGATSWGCSSDSNSSSDTSDSTSGTTGSTGGDGGSSGGDSTASGGASNTSGKTTSSGGGGSGGNANTGGVGGTGGDSGSGGSAGAPPEEIPDPCDDVDDPEMLPDLIDEDVEIGPGCFAMNRTRMAEDTTLTIAAGTTIRVAAAGYLSTGQSGSNDGNGALIAVGEPGAPIRFTSAAPFPVAGNWQCIHVSDSSAGSEFRNVVIEYAGSECINGGQSSLLANGKVAITDSRIAHSAHYGVALDNQGVEELEFNNNTFVDNGTHSIFVTSNLLTSLGDGLSFLMTDSNGDEVANPADRIQVAQSMQGIRNGDLRNPGVPFLIPDGVRVGTNQALTIAAGTRLRMGTGSFDASLGYLATAGTEDEPVTFTSSSQNPEAGDWPCLVLGQDAQLEHTMIEYAGAGTGCVNGVDQKTGIYATGAPTLSNVTVRDVDGPAIYLELCSNLESAWCDAGLGSENVDTPAIECEDAQDACAG